MCVKILVCIRCSNNIKSTSLWILLRRTQYPHSFMHTHTYTCQSCRVCETKETARMPDGACHLTVSPIYRKNTQYFAEALNISCNLYSVTILKFCASSSQWIYTTGCVYVSGAMRESVWRRPTATTKSDVIGFLERFSSRLNIFYFFSIHFSRLLCPRLS